MVPAELLRFSCVMKKNGQTYLKNLTVTPQEF